MHATELRQATYAEAVEALTAALMQEGHDGVRVHGTTVTVASADCHGATVTHSMLLHDVCWFDAHDPISMAAYTLMSLEPTMGVRSPVVLVDCHGEDSTDEDVHSRAAARRHNADVLLGATAALEARGVTMQHEIAGNAHAALLCIASLQHGLERLERAKRAAFGMSEATDANG